jgi:hypothetical protein
MMLSPPDPTSYAWDELRRLCQLLTAAVPSVPVLGYRARLHSLHPFRIGPNWRVNPHVHSSRTISSSGAWNARRICSIPRR